MSEPISPLRQRMIADMKRQLKGDARETHALTGGKVPLKYRGPTAKRGRVGG